jgi:signal transduction histidine kinase
VDETTNYRAKLLLAPIVGAAAPIATSLGISFAISIAYTFIYTSSFGRPSPAELQMLQHLVSKIQMVGIWCSWLVLFGGAYLVARRLGADSASSCVLMALGSWLAAIPFVISYDGALGIGAIRSFFLGLAVVAAGMALGNQVRKSSQRLFDAARVVRQAASVEEMLGAIAVQALRGPMARAALFAFDGNCLRVVGDTAKELQSCASVDVTGVRTSSRTRGLFRLDATLQKALAPGLTLGKARAWGLHLEPTDGPKGILILAPGRGGTLLRLEREAWQAFADQVALTWHRQILLEQVREATRKRERERLSYEIHDGLAQDLISAVLYLETAQQRLASEGDFAGALSEAERIVRRCLATARDLAWSSWGRPERRGTGIEEAISRLAETWAKQTSMDAKVAIVGDERLLPEEVFELLLSATREGLNNVRKHAGATHVCITLTILTHQLALDICDNGKGFDYDATVAVDPSTRRSGFGLTTLRQRVAELHGQFVVESAPGDGTTLSVQLPFGHV